MARKRKIPARKHHGVRDPLKQLEAKEKKLRNVVNNPPILGNDQQISNKFSQFKKLADATKAGKKIKKLHAGREDKPKDKKSKNKSTQSNSFNKFKNIKQFADEPDTDYLKRVNRVTSESLREAQYEAKFGVNVIRDPKTGAITIKKRPKNEIDELIKKKEKERHTRKVRKGGKHNKSTKKPLDPKLAKELIKQAIKETNEEERKETEIEEFKQDVIRFGEIVHAPPMFSTLPRKATKNETVPRPGRKNNLLLKNILENNSSKPAAVDNKKYPQKVIKLKTQLAGKRKNLPLSTRSMLEKEQNKMIELYRQLKKSRSTIQDT